MNVYVFASPDEIGAAVAQRFIDDAQGRTPRVWGLATGASPLPVYCRLIDAYQQGKLSFRHIKTYNLDEYCALPRNDENSYYTFMHRHLFDAVDMEEKNAHFFNGTAPDWAAECRRYDSSIVQDGGIDLQLLGIGQNGHIGFNEPSDAFSGDSFKVELSASTRRANAPYFTNRPMPQYALTMGIRRILAAKQILLIATGTAKADAVQRMIEGRVTPQCPASVLQTHAQVSVFLDERAAAQLSCRTPTVR